MHPISASDAQLQPRPNPEPPLQNLPKGFTMTRLTGLFSVEVRLLGKRYLQDTILKARWYTLREDGSC